jgi:hypothetical protein
MNFNYVFTVLQCVVFERIYDSTLLTFDTVKVFLLTYVITVFGKNTVLTMRATRKHDFGTSPLNISLCTGHNYMLNGCDELS